MNLTREQLQAVIETCEFDRWMGLRILSLDESTLVLVLPFRNEIVGTPTILHRTSLEGACRDDALVVAQELAILSTVVSQKHCLCKSRRYVPIRNGLKALDGELVEQTLEESQEALVECSTAHAG